MSDISKYHNNFNELLCLSQKYKLDLFIPDIKEEISRIKDEQLYLVVLGQFKRGKSTLINALIGDDILPAAVLPLTSSVTLIKYGKDKIIKVSFEDDNSLIIPDSELHSFITEAGNPSNEKKVKIVEIFYPSEFLKDGIVLIDTPGIGSMFLHNTKSTESFIPKIDAALFVLSVDPPVTETEFKFYEEVRNYADKFIFVMNKIDLVKQNELKEILSYTENIFLNSNHNKNLNLNLNLFSVSAKSALEAKLRQDSPMLVSSRISELENGIKDSIKTEKYFILQNSLQKKLDRFASRLSFSLELELSALRTPINIFEEKIKKFNYEMDMILIEKKSELYSFNGKVTDLISWLDDEIREFNKVQSILIYDSVAVYIMSLQNPSKPALPNLAKDYLASKLSSDFEVWRLKFESSLYDKYLDIIRASTSNINGIIKKLSDISSGLFDISSPLLLEEITFETPSKFIYRIKDEPLFLEIDLLKILPYLLPQSMLVKLVLSKMKKEVEEKTMVNSGSISGFYRMSISEAALKFKYEIDAKIDQIIFYINSVITSALKNKNQNEESIAPRLNEISSDLASINSLKLIKQTESSRSLS
ncbi:MAG: dynamin family protein [Bacteroidetes bacterium]|nr:dynamin family protein [Bacteroidota bacterium]